MYNLYCAYDAKLPIEIYELGIRFFVSNTHRRCIKSIVK